MKMNTTMLACAGLIAVISSVGAQQYIQPVGIQSDEVLTSGTFPEMINNTATTDFSSNYAYKAGAYETLTFTVYLGNAYDVTELHFWNYNSSSLMTSLIDLSFRDATGAVVGTWQGQPTIGYKATQGYTSQTMDVGNFSNVRAVDFVLTGSKSGVKFTDVGFGGVATVPEPSSTALLGLGCAAMLIRRRR